MVREGTLPVPTSKRRTQSCPKLWQWHPIFETRHHPRLSITYDTLPARKPFVIAEHPAGLLIVVRTGLTNGQIEDAYQRLLPWTLLGIIADTFGVRLGTLDRDRWWDPEAPADWDTIDLLEAHGRLIPWPHIR